MATPTGTISTYDVNVENKFLSTSRITLNDSAVRTLAEKNTPESQISMLDLRGRSKTLDIQASSPIQNLNIRTAALNAGWDQAGKVRYIIPAGIYIWSDSTTLSALTTGNNFPQGLDIINYGYIIGKGGAGGYQASGENGGDAISIGNNVTIQHYPGSFIAGGGGGGGAYRYRAPTAIFYGAGGGGAGGGRGGNGPGIGAYRGTGGAGGLLGLAGSPGSGPSPVDPNAYRGAGGGAGGGGVAFSGGGGGGGRILPGTGGAGGYDFPINGGRRWGGPGGSGNNMGGNGSSLGAGGGGGWGAAGGTGADWPGGAVYSQGGLAGKAVSPNGYIVNIQAINGGGTLYGSTI